ncbi:hypothetical protein OPV22_004955 [Ensete ventricosum]|uniref:Transcriptional corepressor SEUSS n=1 Tax=Ensete ventricosum TaxID=4639 RepID=A0AAV8RJX8_ENSVE|nr:hypothetical protein OPV22_004955 [Ensete ventricosum]
MVRSGAPRRGKGTRSVPPSPLRRNSRRPVGNHAGSAPSLQPISSLVTPSPKLNTTSNMSFVNDTANVSSLPDHSSGGGRAVAAGGLMATSRNFQRQSGGGGAPDVLGPAKFDPRAFTSSSPTAQGPQPHNLYSRRISLDHSQPYQLSMMQNFQGSSSMPHMQRQKELREELGNVGSTAFVNMEPQMGSSDQNVLLLLSQSPSHTGTVNLEPHQLYSGRGLGPGKMESEHSYSALFLQQQPQPQQLQEQELFKKPRPRPKAASPHISMQQQQLLQMPRPPSQAASAQISPQQQQILRSIPQQQDQLRPVQPKVKSTLYEPGICARRLTYYMYQKQHRPHDNNIGFWRELVAEYFAPNAKRRSCVSLYENGPQTAGVFPQDIWQCEICNRKPARGVVTNVEVLPRLLQIKYATGILEELLYVDMPQEYQNAAGQIVLQYAKAVQESVFEQLRVAREGQLRIVFSPELKICSWEFCARHHEEFIPRRLFMPQVNRLDALVQEYQNSVQNSTFGLSAWELERTCKLLTETAGQLVKAFEVPVVNDLANKKCYLSCLQFLEVLDSMKDLIDYSIQTGTGPIDSLINFPKRIASSSVLHSQQVQQPDGQYTSQCDQTSAHATGVQLLSASSSLTSVANTLNNIPSTCTTTTTAGLLHLNFRHDNWTSNVNGPHTGNTVPTPPASSISWRLSHPNVFPPTPSSIPSTSNNILTSSVNIGHLNSGNLPVITSIMKQPLAQSQEANPTESPSVDRTLQEIMTSQHTGVSSLGHEGVSGTGSGIIGEIRPSKTAGTSRGEMAKNTVAMNEQAGINYRSDDPSDVIHQQQEDMNRLFDGLEPLDNLDILQLIQELSP